MPVDEDGNRADIITGVDSVPGRMNLARLYIPFFNAAARDVRRLMLETLGYPRHFKGTMTMDELISQPMDKINEVVNILLDYYNIISKDTYVEFTQNLTNEERYQWLLDIFNTALYNYLPITTQDPYDVIVTKLNERFKITYGPVTYVAADGEKVTTKNSFRIAPIPIMLLDKFADTWLSVDIGTHSNFGVLTAMNEVDRHTRPWRATPTRVFGETEGRIYACYGGEEMIAELLDRSGNVASQQQIAYNILKAPNPADIERIVDREQIPLGNTRSLQIFNSFLACIGVKIDYKPEEL